MGISLGRGDILGLRGANGSGKSTLLRAITGQIPLIDGSVMIDGIDLAAAPERAKAGFGLAIEPHELPARFRDASIWSSSLRSATARRTSKNSASRTQPYPSSFLYLYLLNSNFLMLL